MGSQDPWNYFKNQAQWAPRFFQTILKKLCFKSKTTGIVDTISRTDFFKLFQTRDPQDYFKLCTSKIKQKGFSKFSEITSKTKHKGIPRFFETTSKTNRVPKIFQITSKIIQKGSHNFFQITSRTKQMGTSRYFITTSKTLTLKPRQKRHLRFFRTTSKTRHKRPPRFFQITSKTRHMEIEIFQRRQQP